MEKITVNDFMKKPRHAEVILEMEKLHPEIRFDCPVKVWLEDIRYRDNDETMFVISVGDDIILNSILFKCEIDFKDIIEIAKDMLEEYLSTCDFSELTGPVPCGNEDIRDCDDCRLYKDKDNGCMGRTFHKPNGAYYMKTKDKWEPIYGEKSENYKKYQLKMIERHMENLMRSCEDKKEKRNYGKKAIAVIKKETK